MAGCEGGSCDYGPGTYYRGKHRHGYSKSYDTYVFSYAEGGRSQIEHWLATSTKPRLRDPRECWAEENALPDREWWTKRFCQTYPELRSHTDSEIERIRGDAALYLERRCDEWQAIHDPFGVLRAPPVYGVNVSHDFRRASPFDALRQEHAWKMRVYSRLQEVSKVYAKKFPIRAHDDAAYEEPPDLRTYLHKQGLDLDEEEQRERERESAVDAHHRKQREIEKERLRVGSEIFAQAQAEEKRKEAAQRAEKVKLLQKEAERKEEERLIKELEAELAAIERQNKIAMLRSKIAAAKEQA
jgi:hypothetical protein